MYTDPAGQYTVTDLPPGPYALDFESPTGGTIDYPERWYNGKEALVWADAVFVTAGSTTANVDTTLAHAGTISGRATDAPGNPLRDIFAQAGHGLTYTDADGRYTITGLLPDDYRVQFSEADLGGPLKDLGALYYGQRTPRDQWAFVHVSQATATTGIDAQLHPGGRISGTVINAAGDPIPGTAVFVEGAGQYATTDAGGHYTIGRLEPPATRSTSSRPPSTCTRTTAARRPRGRSSAARRRSPPASPRSTSRPARRPRASTPSSRPAA
ncbi:MAG: carboxypeptidase regulatory-like domain-containing protein [Actinobacteria bacterium]|nr:carboxypeptidase regulatory-like domain-containing protein [Actinomycetota bacterium]